MRAAAAVLVLGLALAAALALSRGGADAPRVLPRAPQSPAQPAAEREIRAALEDRADALAGSRRVRRIGVRDLRLDVSDLRIGAGRASGELALSYRVAGVAGRFTADRRVSLQRAGRRWRVRSISGTRRRPPWEVAAFRRVRSPHFVLLVPPGVDPVAGGLVAALEAGYAEMRGLVVRGRLRRRYLVVVAADGAQARALTADIRGVESLAALTDTEVRETGPARTVSEVVGQRLLVVWSSFAAAGLDQGSTVVVHELTHAVLAPFTSGRTPAWLTEGVALYVSDDRRFGEAALAGVRLRDLAAADAIARLSGERQSAAYAYSSAAAFYIAERYGRDALLDLYYAFNDPDVGGQREAVRRVLGISPARLERDLEIWLPI